MNINGLGNIYDRTYELHRSNKGEQSFAKLLDKVNEDKNNVTDMPVKESTEEKSDDKKDMPEEEETRTEVVVRPDGSKVLMITVTVGGQEAITSVELAKPMPENIPCKDITGDVDISNVTENLEEKQEGQENGN